MDQKKMDKLDYLQEGRKVRQKIADEVLKLETIKQNKSTAIHALGVDSKYTRDLTAKQIKI
jgi:hypothetical protein